MLQFFTLLRFSFNHIWTFHCPCMDFAMDRLRMYFACLIACCCMECALMLQVCRINFANTANASFVYVAWNVVLLVLCMVFVFTFWSFPNLRMDSVIEAGSAAVAPATAKAPATVAKDTQFNCSFFECQHIYFVWNFICCFFLAAIFLRIILLKLWSYGNQASTDHKKYHWVCGPYNRRKFGQVPAPQVDGDARRWPFGIFWLWRLLAGANLFISSCVESFAFSDRVASHWCLIEMRKRCRSTHCKGWYLSTGWRHLRRSSLLTAYLLPKRLRPAPAVRTFAKCILHAVAHSQFPPQSVGTFPFFPQNQSGNLIRI